jgi:protein-S-isoprenylcysteine O-methyltransferase Ste14
MSLRIVLLLVIVLFPLSEIALAIFKRANASVAEVQDRGSMRLLWIAIGVGVAGAIAAEWVPAARMQLSPDLLRALALALMVGGLALRWAAIVTLGRFFSVDVAIRQDHAVVQTGLYRLARHPSYTGLLLAFLGLGVSFRSWLSLVALLAPVTLAVVGRVRTEERALLAALGAPYAAYCARTRRFIPGVL